MERRCIAERHIWWRLWLPLPDADWRLTETAAEADIARWLVFSSPLPPVRRVV
jgi:hypothetical protein